MQLYAYVSVTSQVISRESIFHYKKIFTDNLCHRLMQNRLLTFPRAHVTPTYDGDTPPPPNSDKRALMKDNLIHGINNCQSYFNICTWMAEEQE